MLTSDLAGCVTLADLVNDLCHLSLKKLLLRNVHLLTPSEVAAVLVGGLGQNGTLEELKIYAGNLRNQVGINLESITRVG